LLINFFFIIGYVSWTCAEPNGAVCWDARAESRPLKGGATIRWQPCSTLCSMFVQPFYFVSYYFYWIEYADYFLHFQETYNSRLRERYVDDPSTHPDFDSDYLTLFFYMFNKKFICIISFLLLIYIILYY
jgi:hypothetical protein